MGTKRDAAEVILDRLAELQRSIAWLSRQTGINYKRLLRELRHSPASLSMYTALLCVRVLDLDMTDLVGEVAA